jgi:hypothetical protein
MSFARPRGQAKHVVEAIGSRTLDRKLWQQRNAAGRVFRSEAIDPSRAGGTPARGSTVYRRVTVKGP